ncbi:hypothetical protein NVP1215B_065 [Vibrio phage 1.215.B._10N.222.54.F7]|nr:hypothetical protein NVP1215A_065 [Vibrio phage 1.215.A._10N.222.54.F7]AUR96088.1 hypothetical protein NVP1215B_065 [Vibrio phage 1.215.B._10N.222.54.F7]
MQKITAEHVLQIANVAPGFRPDLDVSHVGRLVNGEELETLTDACTRLNCTPDELTLEGRKAVIRCANLYSRFNEEIPKPDAFARVYSDGKYDAFPNFVSEYVKKNLVESIDLTKVTNVKKHGYKIGDPSGDHINLDRICANPVVYMCGTIVNNELTDEQRVDCSFDKDLTWVY